MSLVRTWAAGAAVGLMAFTGPAFAQAPPASPPSRWLKTPTSEQRAKMHASIGVKAGRAIVRCHVDAAGAVSACATASEIPAGSGYGQALAALASSFQMKPEMVATEAPDSLVYLTDSIEDFDTPPSWLHKPSERDLLVVWPKAAWAKGRGGKATINCMISLQGALFDCIAIAESPNGENFGGAAVALTPQFLMKPAQLKGQPVVTPVNIPINFLMPKGGGGGGTDDGRQTAPAAMAWLQAPSYAEVAANYPKKARDAHLSGHVTVDCGFLSSGFLRDCTTISEEPKGQGFGAAAHILARQFRAPTQLQGQKLKNTNVQLPFSFDPTVLTDDKPAIGKPQWAALPTADDTTAAFGTVTKAAVGTVRVMLNCTVLQGGDVSDCHVMREDPAGQGVGQAALSLTPHFKITTWTTEGLPTVGGTVNIPLRYEGQTAAAPAAKP